MGCPLKRDAYAAPSGGRFGLMSAVFAQRRTTRTMFTNGHGSEVRRVLDSSKRRGRRSMPRAAYVPPGDAATERASSRPPLTHLRRPRSHRGQPPPFNRRAAL